MKVIICKLCKKQQNILIDSEITRQSLGKQLEGWFMDQTGDYCSDCKIKHERDMRGE